MAKKLEWINVFGCIPHILRGFYFICWVHCAVLCINSDFEPSYKREIIYGGATVTGLGGFVGFLDIIHAIDRIEDSPK